MVKLLSECSFKTSHEIDDDNNDFHTWKITPVLLLCYDVCVYTRHIESWTTVCMDKTREGLGRSLINAHNVLTHPLLPFLSSSSSCLAATKWRHRQTHTCMTWQHCPTFCYLKYMYVYICIYKLWKWIINYNISIYKKANDTIYSSVT